jgi:serine protease AprX
MRRLKLKRRVSHFHQKANFCFLLAAFSWSGFLFTHQAEAQSGYWLNEKKIPAAVLADTVDNRVGDFLVILNSQPQMKFLAGIEPDRKKRRNMMVRILRQAAVSSQPGVTAELDRLGARYRPFWIINAIAVKGTRTVVETLALREDVIRIESDRAFPVLPEDSQLTLPASPNAPPWNIQMIKAPFLWGLGFTGEGRVYANADTGVQWDHPALKNKYRGWAGQAADHNYHWWDAVHEDLNGNGSNPCGFSSPVPCDDNGHGTHTLGTGVGDDGESHQIGVAPGAKWIACRNMEDRFGRPSTYLECYQFFLAPWDLNGQNPDPDKAPDVIGNSYGCYTSEGCSPHTLQQALENLRAAGIFVAASAGNKGSSCESIVDPPGLEDSVVTVGGVNNWEEMDGGSSRGPVSVDGSYRMKPDLVAPGVNVLSSLNGNTYTTMSGTSMAAPHVAGGVALLWSAFPQLAGQVDQTETILKQSAKKIIATQTCGGIPPTQVPNPVFGYGLLDLQAAYINQANSWAPTVSTDSATSITINSATLNGMVNAQNGSTTVTFQYGLTTAYGTTVTADQSPVAGNTDTAVSKAITGLSPDTTYHYRAIATNSAGTTNGEDQTLKTLVAPPSWNFLYLPLILR